MLWESIQKGETIAAYVKNLAKDGRYYWVLAVVMPCSEGYLSIRLKPTSKLFRAVQPIYEKLWTLEHRLEGHSKKRVESIAASRLELLRLLKESGFRSYEAFMMEALSVEMAERAKLLRCQFAGEKESHVSDGTQAMAQLFVETRRQIDQTEIQCDELSETIRKVRREVARLRESEQSILSRMDRLQMVH